MEVFLLRFYLKRVCFNKDKCKQAQCVMHEYSLDVKRITYHWKKNIEIKLVKKNCHFYTVKYHKKKTIHHSENVEPNSFF